MRVVLLSVVLALAAPAAFAGEITVMHATLRVISAAIPGAGYFDLSNGTGKNIALTGARSPICSDLMMHQSATESGMARMLSVARIDVAPGQKLSFKPGGYHLMCMQPAAALATAHTAIITLLFAGGATQDVTFTVVNAKGAPR